MNFKITRQKPAFTKASLPQGSVAMQQPASAARPSTARPSAAAVSHSASTDDGQLLQWLESLIQTIDQKVAAC